MKRLQFLCKIEKKTILPSTNRPSFVLGLYVNNYYTQTHQVTLDLFYHYRSCIRQCVLLWMSGGVQGQGATIS